MKKAGTYISILLLSIFCIYQYAYAKEYLYTFSMGLGYVTKVDTDTGTILLNSQLPGIDFVQEGDSSVYIANNKIFVVNGKHSINILVYDLSTLKQIKALNIQTPHPEVIMFSTPDEKRIFIVWWNTKLDEGAWQFDVYDTNSLEKMTTLDYYFWPKDITFTPDSKTLFSLDNGADIITIFDLTKNSIVNTIDFNSIFNVGNFKKRVEAYNGTRIVAVQTIKDQVNKDQLNDTFFVYDLSTKSSGTRYNSSSFGSYALTINGDRLLQDEQKIVRNEDGTFAHLSSVGRIHVYDTASESQLGIIQYSGGKQMKFLKTHTNLPHAYIIGWSDNQKYLLIVNFETLKVIREIVLNDVGSFYFIKEEPKGN